MVYEFRRTGGARGAQGRVANDGVCLQAIMSLLDSIERRFRELNDQVDSHIRRMEEVERQLNEQLGASGVNVDAIETASSSSEDSMDLMAQQMLENVEVVYGIPRGVTWNDWVSYIEEEDDDSSVASDSTIPQMFTPYHYQADSDSDSDTDTIVDEWADPARSPSYNDIIRSRAESIDY